MAHNDPKALAERVRNIVLSSFRDVTGFPAKPLWARLAGIGSEPWLDTGDIDEISALWSREFTSLTTNNTILNREIQKGTYDELIARVAKELKGLVSKKDLVLELAFVLNAYHGLLLSHRFSARVSVELHTDLAHDVERSVAYGRRYHEISPHQFYVKVPLTAAGILAARRLAQESIPVNFTLGFSARQNWLIASVARPTFVNVFLGRLNSFVADNKLGSGNLVGEKATLASQRCLYELRKKLAIATRQIAASFRQGIQVKMLAGVDVHTIPPKVAREFENLNLALEEITSQVQEDPKIELAPGVEAHAVGLHNLWEVSEDFKAAVRDILDRDLDNLDPSELGAIFADNGVPGIFPDWTKQDIETVTKDGKIPRYDTWKDRLAKGEVGLDALMSLSALHSFATDQKAMDDRIRSLV